MATEEKKVSFQADDKGLSAFMQKVRNDSQRMFQEQIKSAKLYTAEAKDQVKYLQQYITEFQKKNKLEIESLQKRAVILRNKGGFNYENQAEAAAAERKAVRLGSEGESRTGVFKEMLDEMKKDSTPEKKRSIFAEVLRAGLLRDFGAVMNQIPNARNGTEVISTFSGLGGAGLGALAGAPFLASAAGAQIGKSIGEFFGNAMTRHLQEQSRFQGSQGILRGLGLGTNVEDLSHLGMDRVQSAHFKAMLGRSSGISGEIDTIANIMKAFGLSDTSMGSYYGGARMGGVVGMNTLLSTARNRGVKDVDMERVIQNQTALTSLVAQSAIRPNTPEIAKALFEFDRIGGPFGIKDPRSLELLSTIHGNVANPNSPFGQAMNYSILRRLNPNLGVAGLLEEEQRGIENRDLTSGIIEDIKRRGGSKDFQILSLAQRFGLEGNIGAARKLYEGSGELNTMTSADMKSFTDQEMRERGAGNVAPLEVNQAKITNAFIIGMTEGIGTVSSVFKKEMSIAAEEAANDIAARISGAFNTGPTSSVRGKVPHRSALVSGMARGN